MKRRTAEDVAAMRAASKSGQLHYTGDECEVCKQTTRYAASNRCVLCVANSKARRMGWRIKQGFANKRRPMNELYPLTEQEKFMAAMLRQWRIVPSDYNRAGDYSGVSA